MALIDPVESWFLRNTGQRLTPVSGVESPTVPPVDPAPWGAQTLAPRAESRRGNPTRMAGPPLRPGGVVEDTYRDQRANARAAQLSDVEKRLASEKAEAQRRRNQQTMALNEMRRERLARIEQSRARSQAQAAARASDRIRQIQEQQNRLRLSMSRARSAVPLTPQQMAQANRDIFTPRSGSYPAALAPEWWDKGPGGSVRAPFTAGTRVGPGQTAGRSTVKRDADGSRDGGQYYALRPRMEVTWGAPKYLVNDQFTYAMNKTDAEIRRLQVGLLERGFFSTQGQIAYIPGKLDSFTREAIEAAMRRANETGDTIETLLAAPSRFDANGDPYGSGPGGGLSGPRTIKDVQKVYDITSLDRGAATLRAIMARELGRQPTAAEIKNYIAQLNAKERANPDIVTTTSTRNASGSYNTSTQIREGKRPEPEEQAIGYAKAGTVGVERQEFQEARYYEALVDLIGGEANA